MARRSKYQREKDLAELARRYLQGEYQADIAADMGVSQVTISKDLKTLQGRWQKSALVDIDEAKARELARIDHLEREYWTAWGRSRDVREVAKAEKRDDKTTRSSLQKEQRDGNPAFLAGVMQCIDRRCKIMGFDAPVKQELSGVIAIDISDDEVDAELAQLFNIATAQAAGLSDEGS